MTSVQVPVEKMHSVFGNRLQENVPLANYTTARVGGSAKALIVAHTLTELAEAVSFVWDEQIPYIILGGGTNMLVSDDGFPGVVILDRARNVRIDAHTQPPRVYAESGANLSALSRQVALRGLSGLEWAASVPGTVGGAVYGNAGAFGGDMATNLIVAEILHPNHRKEVWPVERLEYQYRSSVLKREDIQAVVLWAEMRLALSTIEEVRARMEENSSRRKNSQPPGATLGSMFKNPPGDYAGRLIEAAGLKGKRIGGAEISTFHANFFVNMGDARADDFWQLIQVARNAVSNQFGVHLELEIELVGEYA